MSNYCELLQSSFEPKDGSRPSDEFAVLLEKFTELFSRIIVRLIVIENNSLGLLIKSRGLIGNASSIVNQVTYIADQLSKLPIDQLTHQHGQFLTEYDQTRLFPIETLMEQLEELFVSFVFLRIKEAGVSLHQIAREFDLIFNELKAEMSSNLQISTRLAFFRILARVDDGHQNKLQID